MLHTLGMFALSGSTRQQITQFPIPLSTTLPNRLALLSYELPQVGGYWQLMYLFWQFKNEILIV